MNTKKQYLFISLFFICSWLSPLFSMDKQKAIQTRWIFARKPKTQILKKEYNQFATAVTSEKIKKLLEQRADPNTPYDSALVLALDFEDIDLVALCLSYGADPNITPKIRGQKSSKDKDMPTIVCFNLKKKNKEFFKKASKLLDIANQNLLQGNIPEKAFWNNAEKQLYKAAKNEAINLKKMKQAIENGADPNSYFAEPLLQAIKSTALIDKKIRFIAWLLKNKADPDRAGFSGYSAWDYLKTLPSAIKRKKTEVIDDYKKVMEDKTLSLLWELPYNIENRIEEETGSMVEIVETYQKKLQNLEIEQDDIKYIKNTIRPYITRLYR